MKRKSIIAMMLALSVLPFAGNLCVQAEEQEIVEIVWQYPTDGNIGTGFQDVEDALNEMLERDIGVHVTFEPVGLGESQQTAQLMIAAGEQLDLCLTAFTSLNPLVDGGYILPLTDIVEEYGEGFKELGMNLSNGYYQGELYGIAPHTYLATNYQYLIKTEYLDKYGITIDPEKTYTYEDLEEIFMTIKAGEGENFYALPIDATISPMETYFTYDKLGASSASGVLMLNRSFDDLTIYNIYETEEYKTYAETLYRWAQNGLIAPDAAVTSETTDTLVSSDNYLGTFYFGQPTSALEYGALIGHELQAIKLMDNYVVDGAGGGVWWSVPITSANPEKAIEALEYIYTHDEANYILMYGLEGVSYEVTAEDENGIQIKFLSDDVLSLPYYNPYGLWGNQCNYAAIYPATTERSVILEEFENSTSPERWSPAMGYSFDSSSVSTEIASVSAVIEQYGKSINCGALDPEKALPEFINSLKSAGIDKVIAENQRQLDEWAAVQK